MAQARAISVNRVDMVSGIDFARIPSLAISACGTAYLAGLIGKYWFERYARLPVEIDVASEFRYREIPLSPQSAALFISQSGETADTLASLRYCKQLGLKIGAVVNARESTIAREADVVFPILAGPEIGVASTKAFTCQLAVLAALAIHAAKARGTVTEDEVQALVASLTEMPRLMRQVLDSTQPEIELLSRELSKCHHVLYLGRGTSFPLAMEGELRRGNQRESAHCLVENVPECSTVASHKLLPTEWYEQGRLWDG